MVHEDVEHDRNIVVVEDCSTSCSSDAINENTSSTLDKMEDDASSDASDDSTSSTLDGNNGTCSNDDATTSSPTSSYCFMSQGDTKVS
ncbi:hypothetical protein, partial [Aeromonas jandaei]|uniref:hypothetical protein n=1 Tax=Aeromonas jandaei TaxID=650 RepID=UPI0012EC1271